MDQFFILFNLKMAINISDKLAFKLFFNNNNNNNDNNDNNVIILLFVIHIVC